MSSSLDARSPDDPALLDPCITALRATAVRDLGRTPVAEDMPDLLFAAPASLVDRAAEQVLLSCCDAAWVRGWLPAEVLHQAGRGAPAAVGHLVASAIANDHAGRRSTTLHPRWVQHLEALDLPVADGRTGWVSRWAQEAHTDRSRAIASMVHAISRIVLLSPLDPLLPAPGVADTVVGPSWYLLDTDGAASPVLQRIRALLAKAESTTYEAEADAFTAKAAALMTKHAIDAALVADRSSGARAVATRLCIDSPYVDMKSLLLHVVSEATRCRVVQHRTYALCTVVGHAADLQAVELLYTSLLVQAQAALDDALRRAGRSNKAGNRTFRSSFLAAYAHRIGQRLSESNAEVLAEASATHGAALVPVLAERAREVDDYVDRHFADLRTLRSRRTYDAAGYASGHLAADRANLTHGEVR